MHLAQRLSKRAALFLFSNYSKNPWIQFETTAFKCIHEELTAEFLYIIHPTFCLIHLLDISLCSFLYDI